MGLRTYGVELGGVEGAMVREGRGGRFGALSFFPKLSPADFLLHGGLCMGAERESIRFRHAELLL
jgi:hypothetical protein